MKAFTGTLDKVNAFTKDMKNYDRINTAGILIDMWEKENGRGPQVSLLKDLVNPCQRLVQKVRYAGLEREFSRIVNTEGLTRKAGLIPVTRRSRRIGFPCLREAW